MADVVRWGAVVASLACITALVAHLGSLRFAEIVPMTLFAALGSYVALRPRPERDLADPFTFAVWTTLVPMYVIGATMIAIGAQRPFYLGFLNGGRSLVAAQLCVGVGLVGLWAGARSRLGVRRLDRIVRVTPRGPSGPQQILVLGWVALFVGLTASFVGQRTGAIGATESPGRYAALLSLTGPMSFGAPLLLLAAMRAGCRRRHAAVLAIATVAVALGQTVLIGNRGTVLSYLVVAVIGLGWTGRVLPARRIVAGLVAVGVAVVLATSFGSSLRDERAAAPSASLVEVAQRSLADVVRRGPAGIVSDATSRLRDRFDSLGSAAVVIERRAELESHEQAFGVDRDIVNGAINGLVPRALWPSKPATNDPRWFSELYFGYRNNSYGTTVYTDLLRNFGPLGVPLGMFVLGLVLMWGYRLLAAPTVRTPARSFVYVLVLTRAVNLEASYSTILPDGLRIVAVSTATMALGSLVGRLGSRRWSTAGAVDESEAESSAQPAPLSSVMVVCDGFAPGSAGGSIRTLVNVTDRLADELDWWVLTRDRDYASPVRYEGVSSDWERRSTGAGGRPMVAYCRPWRRTPSFIARQLAAIQPDVVVVNSLFGRGPISTLIARRLGQLGAVGVVVAPEGELDSGALAGKQTRKTIALTVFRWSGLYSGVVWRAAGSDEVDNIRRFVGDVPIYVASSPPPRPSAVDNGEPVVAAIGGTGTRLLCLGSIVAKKNPLFLVELISARAEADLTLDFIGPHQDGALAHQLELAAGRDQRIRVLPQVEHARVAELMGEYDVLMCPTEGENFGYTIAEALTVGLPVMVSDRTPWCDLREVGAGWTLPLADRHAWDRALDELLGETAAERSVRRSAARRVGASWLAEGVADADWRRLVDVAAGGGESEVCARRPRGLRLAALAAAAAVASVAVSAIAPAAPAFVAVQTQSAPATVTPDGASWSSADGTVVLPTLPAGAPVLGDIDGDGSFDPLSWGNVAPGLSGFVWTTVSLGSASVAWGIPGDDPRGTADFDGDRRADLTVVRIVNDSLVWYTRTSRLMRQEIVQFGRPGDLPVPGDYFGIGRAQRAVVSVDPATNDLVWRIDAPEVRTIRFGDSSMVPVPGDYDGDGVTEVAVFRPGDSTYLIRDHSGAVTTVQVGQGAGRPASCDANGDGVLDPAVYRSDGSWSASPLGSDATIDVPLTVKPGSIPLQTALAGGLDG